MTARARRKTFPAALVLNVLFLSGACDFFRPVSGGDGASDEPSYAKKVVWEVDTAGSSCWGIPLIDGKYAYYPAGGVPYGGHESKVLKIDLDDGSVVWETDLIPVRSINNPQKIGDKLYVSLYDRTGYMGVFDDRDGRLLVIVRMGETDKEAEDQGPGSIWSVVDGDYLFFNNSPTYTKTWGLMRLDTGKIDMSREDEIQTVEPEMIWSDEARDSRIGSNIVMADGVVYFTTVSHTYYDPAKVARLIAVDGKTGEVKWDRDAPHMSGGRKFSLLLNGKKLHVLDNGPSCYDKDTGEPLYENGLDYNNPNVPPLNNAAYSKGATVYENKIYFTSNTTLSSKVPRLENILCIDVDTGRFVWGAVNPKAPGAWSSISLFNFPVAYKGRAYITTDRGLRVYDADTGRLIGVDYSAKSYMGSNYHFIYKDYYVYVHDNDASVSLVAVALD